MRFLGGFFLVFLLRASCFGVGLGCGALGFRLQGIGGFELGSFSIELKVRAVCGCRLKP